MTNKHTIGKRNKRAAEVVLDDNVFFTADQHFWHKNIIKHCNRPFENMKEMNHEMTDQWNKVVTPNALVYHLGDFCFGSLSHVKYVVEQLNGFIAIVPGNHDGTWLSQYLRLSERDRKEIRSKNGVEINVLPPIIDIETAHYDKESEYPLGITLCHYQMTVWNKSHHGAFQLFGHQHLGPVFGLGRQMNVSVDLHGYQPVHIDKVIEQLKDRKNVNELEETNV